MGSLSPTRVFNCILQALEAESPKEEKEDEFDAKTDYYKSLAHLTKNMLKFDPVLTPLSLTNKDSPLFKALKCSTEVEEQQETEANSGDQFLLKIKLNEMKPFVS